MERKRALRLARGYVLEFGLGAGIYLFCLTALGPAALAEFVKKTADEWNDLTAGLFATAVAIWLTAVNLMASDFGSYLEYKKRNDIGSHAFLFPMAIFFLTTVALISNKGIASSLFSNISFFLLVYCAGTLLILIRSAKQLVEAHGEFRAILKAVESEEQGNEPGGQSVTLSINSPERAPGSPP